MDKNIKEIRVSVIIPTYNRCNSIIKSLNSVINQDYKNIEIIIIDDGSTDKTSEAISNFQDNRIIYVKNDKNIGIAKSRNKGISLSTGKYIAMIDSDDVWIDNTKISNQVSFMESNQNHGLVGTFFVKVKNDEKKYIKYEKTNEKIKNKILIRNQFAQSTIMIRSLILNKSGLYDEKLIIWEDWDLWLRIGRYSKLGNIPIHTTHYLVGEDNISHNKSWLSFKTTIFIINKYSCFYSGKYIAHTKNIIRFLKNIFF